MPAHTDSVEPKVTHEQSAAVAVLRRAVAAAVLCVFFTPLVVTSDTLFPFTTGKALAARVLIEIAAFLYVWLLLVDPSFRPRIGKIGAAVLAYAAVASLSTLAGVNPYRSFWGNLVRMEGLIGLLHAVALFVIVASVFRTRSDWLRLFEASLVASGFVGLFALVEANASEIALGVQRYRPGSTLGQPDFLATYAMFHVFFAFLAVAWEPVRWRRWVAGGLGVLNLAVLAFTASRGAWLGLYVAAIVGAVLYAVLAAARSPTRAIAAGLMVALLAAPLAVRTMQGTALLSAMPHFVQRLAGTSLADPSTQTRLRSLRISLEALKDRPLLGWGPDNFRVGFDRHFDPANLDLEQWFDRPHDKPAEVAIETGLAGLVSYLAIFAFAGASLARFVRQSPSQADRHIGIAALLLGVAYFVQNLVLFDTPVSTILFFCTLGFAGFLTAPAPASREAPSSWRAGRMIALAGAGALMVTLVVFANWKPFEAALLGRQAAQAQSRGGMLDPYERAMATGGFARAEVTRAVMDAFIDQGRARSREWTDVFERLRDEAEAILAEEPTHTPLFMRVGNLYNERTEIEPRYSADAERVLTAAIALSPTRPDAYYELGVTYLKRRDPAKAQDVFRRVVALNDRNTWAHWGLGLAQLSAGANAQGLAELDRALRMGADWDAQPELYVLTQIFVATQPVDKLIAMYEKVIDARPGVAKYRVMLAIAYANAGMRDRAREEALRAAALDPDYAAGARQFVEQLR